MADDRPATTRLSPLATPSATRAVLERHGLYTKYALGQNFLVNDDVVRKIIDLADVRPDDRILEVGPGIGTLTSALLHRAAHVTAVEKDRDLPAVLADTLAPWQDRLTLLQMDALDLPAACLDAQNCAQWECFPTPGAPTPRETFPSSAILNTAPASVHKNAPNGKPACTKSRPMGNPSQPELLEQPQAPVDCATSANFAAPATSAPNKLVSNLPYAVAATIVLDYLQRLDFLESATVMVQREVADRMTARPGTKVYGAYTVKLSLVARPAGRFSVAPGNFFPPPHVESAVLRLDRVVARDGEGRELTAAELEAACTMADAAFATRRKTLANSCKTYFSGQPDVQAALPRIFEQAAIDPRRRGETLDQQEFIRLARAFLQA